MPSIDLNLWNLSRPNAFVPCEGGVDVVGVVNHLVRGGAQVLHGDQVVELSVLLDEKENMVKDRSKQRVREVNSRRDAHEYGCHDGTQNLSHEVHVTQHQSVSKTTRSQCMLKCCAS